MTIDRRVLKQLCPLNHKSISQKSSTSSLPVLPTEIWIMVLLAADIRTLTIFRDLSRAARDLVDSLLPYREIVTHFPDLLRAALCVGPAFSVSVAELGRAFRSHKCESCSRDGEYIYLLGCLRICKNCLLIGNVARPVTLSYARERFSVGHIGLVQLPRLLTITGNYGPRRQPIALRTLLVDNARVRSLAKKKGPNVLKEITRLKVKMSQPELYPFTCSIRAPWYDDESGTIQWGYHCKPCIEHRTRSVIETTYQSEGFLNHVGHCDFARAVWASFSPSRRR